MKPTENIIRNRRQFLQLSGMLGLGVISSCAPSLSSTHSRSSLTLPKLNVSLDRVIKETVGLRPFRKNGNRLEKETVGSKTVVHNYGHGGSGWSLSWGTGRQAVALAETTGEKKFAVMGCGVVGITTARLLQRKGFDVTIYTKDLPPQVTSSKATGTWSPSYRLIEDEHMTDAFKERWEQATHYSFLAYQNLLGLNDIVTWMDEYVVRQNPRQVIPGHSVRLEVPKLLPEDQVLEKGQHPFAIDTVVKHTSLVFNIPSYLNKHITDFFAYGGSIKIKAFNTLEDVDALPEKCVVNCTGLGSKALFNDINLTPVSGQLSFLIPQPDFNYRLTTDNGYAIPRKDGIVLGGNALIDNWDDTPNQEQTEKVVKALQEVMRTMRG